MESRSSPRRANAEPSESPGELDDGGLQIRLLGDLQVVRAGRVVALPASKRTRALLGYLVAVAAPQTRQSLCDLLWDGPDDPRAALRWSLTKLRPVVDDARIRRLDADRERVAFEAGAVSVDVARVRALLDGEPDRAGLDALEAAAQLFRGEFLDGLDLPGCIRFHHWCMAERERLGSLHRGILRALIARLDSEPERALPHARALVAIDPLSETAHAAVVRLLAMLGRSRDAESQYARAREMLTRELAAPLSGALRAAFAKARWHRPVAEDSIAPAHAHAADPPTQSKDCPSFVGRTAERDAIERAAATLATDGSSRMLLFLGEPGIGKTRLLDVMAATTGSTGARVVMARCFEAEAVRPYGVLIDALRGVPADLVPDALRGDLAILVPAFGSPASGGSDRTRLLASVAGLAQSLAERQGFVLLLDDLQWIDEASASLVHYLVRTSTPRVVIAGAARLGEIDDNAWAKRLVHSLARDGCLDRYHLSPLGHDEIALLLGLDPEHADVAAVLEASGGNPLFALAVASARQRGADLANITVESLVADQVERLDEAAREPLVWAAAIGREFRPELLAAALDVPEAALLGRIERLERRGLLRPGSEGHFDFVHDLVRQATYRAQSQPRRRVIHRRIARALAAAVEGDDSLHGDLVRHAALAEDHRLAVRACIAAGERCLRMFANRQALDVAERGLAQLARLPPGEEPIRQRVALLGLKVFAAAGPMGLETADLLDQLGTAVDAATAMGLHGDAAHALHLTAWLQQQSNDVDRTQQATLQAEKASRGADEATRCQQLANTGRCLLEVEREVPRALALIDEARSMAEALGLHFVELEWARALAARWNGALDQAHALMSRALVLARLRQERWREVECLVWLAMIDLEWARFDSVPAHCDEIERIATRMGQDEAPVAKTLRALALHMAPVAPALAGPSALAESFQALRARDDKAHLAHALNCLAAFELAQGRRDQASTAATEALAAAGAVRRASEMAIATAILARIAAIDGGAQLAAAGLRRLASADGSATLSARAQAHVEAAMREIGLTFPTLVQTQGA